MWLAIQDSWARTSRHPGGGEKAPSNSNAEHKGRIFKAAGDGFLAEFPSGERG